MANVPISFTDIHLFANIKGVDDFDEFHYLMRKLDTEYIKIREEKDAKPS